jgi:hypothetical protein
LDRVLDHGSAGLTGKDRLPVQIERAFELLHTVLKRRWAVVLPERRGIFPAAVLFVALPTVNFLAGLDNTVAMRRQLELLLNLRLVGREDST